MEVNMSKFRKPLWMALLVSVMVVFACVTINIYFPAAAAEEAARTIRQICVRTIQNPAPPEQLRVPCRSLIPDPDGVAGRGR